MEEDNDSDWEIKENAPLTPERLAELEREMSKEYFLNAILRDTKGRNTFMEFLNKSYCAESLMFWIDVERYKDIEDDARRKKRANEIYAKYIMSSSPYELNLPWVLRQEVAGRLSEATVDTFQNVQKDMFVLMANTNFDQFLRSDIYKRFKADRDEAQPTPTTSRRRTGTGASAPKQDKQGCCAVS